MKKILSFVLGLVAMTTLQAANTASVTFTLNGNGGTEASQLKLRLDPTVTEATTAEWFPNYESVGTVNLYANVGGTKYSQYKYNTLTNTPLEIVTNRRAASLQHYTITFAVFTNTEVLYLTDLAVDPNNPIAISNGDSYEFDVNTTLHPDYVEGTNYVVKNRFMINYARVSVTGSWGWDPWLDFVENGDGTASVSKTLTAGWYNFGLHFGTTWATNGYAYTRSYTSTPNFVGGSSDNMSMNADVDGTYTFKWEYATNTFSIIFPEIPTVYSVTTNEDGWASYSSDIDLLAPAGLTIYEGALNGDELTLTQKDYVKANQGVIVKGEAGQTYVFTAGSGADSYDNILKPSSAWASHSGTIYCLRHVDGEGTALYQYTGSVMPANKAYLEIIATPSSPAPRRISFRFNQPTAIENAKAADVKAEKFVGEDGQILIKRGNEIFNLQGQMVK